MNNKREKKNNTIMSCFRSNPLLFLLFFISSALFSFSHGATPEFLNVREFGGLAQWKNAKKVLNGNSSNNSETLILAANRTHRRDPIDGFTYYTGGWNITNQHYLYSVALSAAPLFVIAIIWFVVFGLCLCFICLRCVFCCCCRRDPYGYSRTAYALSLIFLVLFTIAAIAGSVFLYTGQGKFQNSTVNVLSYVLKQANTIVQNLREVLNYLLGAKKIGVGKVTLPAEFQANIDDMQTQINFVANNLQNVTGKNSKNIRDFLDPIRISLICVTAAMLLLALLGLLFSILGLQGLVFFLMIIGWIAVAGTFILGGMFLLVHNVVADTCVAMDEWLQNPTANSALENIIPRANDQIAQAILTGTKGVSFALVNVANTAITNVYNVGMPPNAGPLYYNQSGPLVPLLCNPFTSKLTERQCAAGEVDFKNAAEVWRSHMCQVSASGICTTLGRVTPNGYNELTASLNISYGLYHYGPFLVDLIDSTYVKETFSAISKNYCPSMRKSTKQTYAGFTVVSTAIMLSLIVWLVYGRERRHRKYTKKLRTTTHGSPLNEAT